VQPERARNHFHAALTQIPCGEYIFSTPQQPHTKVEVNMKNEMKLLRPCMTLSLFTTATMTSCGLMSVRGLSFVRSGVASSSSCVRPSRYYSRCLSAQAHGDCAHTEGTSSSGGDVITIRNSLIDSNAKKALKVEHGKPLTWYSCGPTVYEVLVCSSIRDIAWGFTVFVLIVGSASWPRTNICVHRHHPPHPHKLFSL
jgi:hypothetical protein